jgi:LacI family transcriptional regulator
MRHELRIGLLFATDQLSYDRKVIEGVLAYQQQNRCQVFTLLGAMLNDKLGYLKRQIRLDGIIAEIWNPMMLRTLQHIGIPVVDISGTWDPPSVPSVHVDNRAVGRMVAQHFLDKGLRQLAFFGNPGAMHSRERQDGFVEQARQAGAAVAVIDLMRHYEAKGEQEDIWAVARWLKRLPKPAGLMCWYDYDAPWLEGVCERAKAAVPEDVAIVGVDNDDLACASCRRKLSSVETNGNLVGYQAMCLMRQLVRGKPAPRQHVLVQPGNLIGRESSDIQAISNVVLARAIRFMQDNVDRPINVESVLREIPLSRRIFETQLRAACGHSPYQYITRLRVERAKKFLAETDMDMPSIARSCGISNSKLFSVIFKRIAGVSPRQYQRQIRLGRTIAATPAQTDPR